MRMMMILITSLFALEALADEPTGRWQLDRQSFDQQLAAFVETQLGDFDNLPPEKREEMQTMLKAIVSQAMAEIEGIIEFRADGTVAFIDLEGNEEGTGTWLQDGNSLTVIPDSTAKTLEPLRGILQDDVITVKPNFEAIPDDSPIMNMTFRRIE